MIINGRISYKEEFLYKKKKRIDYLIISLSEALF
jgi:hypothetical protein